MIFNKLPIYASAILCSFIGANAESEIVDLAPYEVQATRLPMSSIPLNQSGIDSGFAGASLRESFNSLNGLHFQQVGGAGGNIEFIVRGAEPNFTKIYIEGIEVNDPTDSRGGGYQFTQLSPSLFGSVQLSKGSNSAVWGSDAMSGVLSIELGHAAVTRDEQLWFHGTIGSYGFRESGLSYQADSKPAAFQIQLAKVVEDDRFEGSSYKNKSGFFKAQFELSKNDKIQIAVWKGETERTLFPDDSGGPLYAVSRSVDSFESNDIGFSAKHQRAISDQIRWSNLVGVYQNESLMDSPGVPPGERNPFGVPPNRFENTFTRYQFDSFLMIETNRELNWVLGVSGKKEQGESLGSVVFPFGELGSEYDQTRDSLATYSEIQLNLSESQSMSIAVRGDKIEGFDLEWSPSIEYLCHLDGVQTQLHVSYDHGFKVPSFFALHNALVGNRDIVPESVDSFQVGFMTDLNERFSAGMTWFQQDYEGLIDMSEVTQTLVNLAGVNISGIEASAHWDVSDTFSFRAFATHLNIDLDDEGEVLRHRPEWTYGVLMDWTIYQNALLSLSYRHIDQRWDSSIPTGNVELNAYAHFDLIFKHEFSESIHFSFVAFNLFDRKDETSIGYVERGRHFRFSMNVGF